jgi:anthranilate phosphoribosyltransferase
MEFRQALSSLMQRQDLTGEVMEQVMDQVMDGQLTPAQIGGLLVALHMKGETVHEIAGAARSMRRHATRIDAGPLPIVDTCGTGGDGAGTFNISTTAALIAAGAGAKVAKHGNRSVSSHCGSADVLMALGVNVDLPPEQVGACVREVGIGFLFAPKLHGAMKHAIGPRRELGVRTLFNILGPMSNPAGADRQVIGVFAPDLTEIMASVLGELGTKHAMVVHGHDQLDEITGTTLTRITEWRDGAARTWDLDPVAYLGRTCQPSDLKGGDATANAAITRAILGGEDSPRAGVACLNAAAAILVAGLATDLHDGMAQARQAISSGQALAKLNALVQASNR